MAQQQKTNSRTTSNEDNINNSDYSWKAVGSPSRRGSLFDNKISPTDSPKNDHMETPLRRSSIVSDSNWGSFGGFQWEGPSIFDEEGKPINTPASTPAPNDILSVPMLPNVSLEPIYRQHRSLSFSMGQDPTFFGYDDYEDSPTPTYQSTFKSSLAPMEEEEDVYDEAIDFNYIRSRSKSSGAAFGLLSQNQYSRLLNMRRGSEQQEDLLSQRRRSSRFFNSDQMSLGDKERLDTILQRRLSQQQEYAFPDIRRQSLTLNNQPPANIQQLADQLENTHMRSDFAVFQQSQQQQQQQQQYQYRPIPNDLYTQHLQQQPLFNNYPYYQSQPETPQMQQPMTDPLFDTDPRAFQDLGKGIPISQLNPKTSLYMVEFKGGRTDFFYVLDIHPQVGDLVIVEGDRGKDLGKVAANTLTIQQVIILEQKKQAQLQQFEKEEPTTATAATAAKPQKELHIKRIIKLASPEEINLLFLKGQDEHKALVVCQQKTKQRKLPMEVVDAEYQWDRRKLTFYFEAENRIDFRELVRELFKIYKTRIWMCVVTSPITQDDIDQSAEVAANKIDQPSIDGNNASA